MDKPFEIKTKRKADKLTLKFSGSLVINSIEEITNEVKEKMDTGRSIHVYIANPENIDLTFIQLVMSIRKTCINKNIEFTVSAKIKEDLKLLLTNAGFSNIISN